MGIVQVIIDRTTSMNIEGVYEFDRAEGGTLVAPSGAAFPVTPVAGEWFWRTDLVALYRYSGTVWESITGGFTNPMTSRGDLIVGGNAGTPERLAGVAGSYLRSGGPGVDVAYTRTFDVNTLLAGAAVDDTIDPSAVLQANSTTAGFLPPRMTKAQRDAIVSPADGLLVYLPVEKRASYFDGTNWRNISVSGIKTITVSSDGTGDFATVTAALDSILDAATDNRYQVLIGPGNYVEDVTLKDFVTLTGVGWDSVIEGSVDLTGVGEATIYGVRVEATNVPAVIGAGTSALDGVDLLDAYFTSTYDSSVSPTVVRCVLAMSSGLVYAYKETEFALYVYDVVNVAASTIQTLVHVSGSGPVTMEWYGAYCYMDTDNPGNTCSAVYTENSHSSTQVLIEEGAVRQTLTGTSHANISSLVFCEGAHRCHVDGVRWTLDGDSVVGARIRVARCVGGASGAAIHITKCEVSKSPITDANTSLGEATAVDDFVELLDNSFFMEADVLPVRYTADGALGTFYSSHHNNYGSSWTSGRIQGVRHYGSAASDPTTPTPTDGDRYYNTSIYEEMRYDGSRSKWLSVADLKAFAGKTGSNATGSFYRGLDGLTFGTDIGIPVMKGTLIGLAWSRTDSDAATLECLVDTTVVAELASSASGLTADWTKNADFNAGLMKFRNKSGGNTTSNVQITAVYKRRA